MMQLALFSFLGLVTGTAVVLSQHRRPDVPSSTYWNIGLVAMASTAVVAAAAYITTSFLWVGQGELGMPQLGPVAMASCGFFPAFLAGLAACALYSGGRAEDRHEVLTLLSGFGLGAAVAALAVVSGQAIVELRPELSRAGFMGLLGLTQALLLVSPALGFTTIALNAQSAKEADETFTIASQEPETAATPEDEHATMA